MPPEPVVELVLSLGVSASAALLAVEGGVGPGQRVHLGRVSAVSARVRGRRPAGAVVQPVLHVGLVVEVGHLPAVLLVVVVVRVGGVVRGGDGLGVGGGRAVVEVDLGAVLLGGGGEDLLGGGAAGAVGPHADHPDQQDQDDDEDDGAGDAPGHVGELGLLLAVLAGEGAGALAVRGALLVLEADALVEAVVVAEVGAVAVRAGAVVAGLALAGEAVRLLQEEAVGVLVAKRLLALGHAAAVGALVHVGGAGVLGGRVGRTLEAVGLLGLVLE